MLDRRSGSPARVEGPPRGAPNGPSLRVSLRVSPRVSLGAFLLLAGAVGPHPRAHAQERGEEGPAIAPLDPAASAPSDDAAVGGVPALVLDRMVLVIGDRIVTESELRLEAALRARVAWWGPPRPPGADMLQVVADAALVRILAGDTSLYAPSDEAVRARAGQLRAEWGDPEGWQAFLAEHGLDELRLLALIRGRMVVERYLQRNLSLAARSAGKTVDELYLEWIPAQRGRVPQRLPSAVP